MSPMCSDHRRMRAHFSLALLNLVVCSAQFGGGGYAPPAPVCKPFACAAGTKAAGNGDHKLWSYGCKDSGLNILSMADLNNPLGGMNKGKNVDKCCVERDICRQTCGSTSVECHNNFQACSKKVCKGDQNCDLAAMMSDIRSDPEDDEEEAKAKKDPPEEYNYEKDRQKRDCRGYEKAQKAACICVPNDDWQLTTNGNLKDFYRKYNSEKLDDSGEIKDIEDVWKKWKGKEPQMFQALAGKYKAKAVTIKEKPKPPPYKPPPAPPPLSKEEQEKEDKRMAEMREKWKKEDAAREAERQEREQKKAEEREEEERRRTEEVEGETVEL